MKFPKIKTPSGETTLTIKRTPTSEGGLSLLMDNVHTVAETGTVRLGAIVRDPLDQTQHGLVIPGQRFALGAEVLRAAAGLVAMADAEAVARLAATTDPEKKEG